jgi:hypothetical protein
MCNDCKRIGNEDTFRKALKRRGNEAGRDQSRVNFRASVLPFPLFPYFDQTNSNGRHRSFLPLQFISQPGLVEIARSLSAQLGRSDRQLWLARQNLMRRSQKLRSVRDNLQEKVLRNDVRGLVNNTITFAREGEDEKRSAILPFICDLMRSAVKRDADTGHGSLGMRWTKTSLQIFAVMKKKGGKSLLEFIKQTAEAAADSSVMGQ